jgi:hypothetical protein
MIVLCLWAFVVLLVASPIRGQESKPDKVKLTGAELEKLNKPGAISFGINHRMNIVSIIENLENGKRSIFLRSLLEPSHWYTGMGTYKIVGDQLCTKWPGLPENCSDIYRVGEDKYESWSGGTLGATWYRGQREYETNKDKVKLTGAELKEEENQYSVSAGVNYKAKWVNIIVDYPDGKRELYWRSLSNPNNSAWWPGTKRIVGDQVCVKMRFGPESCVDIYRINEDQIEVWLGSDLVGTFYRLK